VPTTGKAAGAHRSPGPAWLQRLLPFDGRIAVTDAELAVLVICNLITTVGLAGDISRHLLHPEQLNSGNDFLSGWHLVLYGGVASVGLWLGVGALRRGRAYVRAASATAVGFGLLTLGGLCDAAWHKAFGTEALVEALVSPPHLVVFAGLVFLLASPIVVLWHRPERRLAVVPSLAVVLSIVSVVLVTSLFTGFLSPLAGGLSLQGYVEPLVGESLQDYDQVRGLGIAIWTVTVLVASTTVVLVRFRPIRGSLLLSYVLIGVPALVVTNEQGNTPAATAVVNYSATGEPLTSGGSVMPLVLGFAAAGLASEVVVALFARPVLRRIGASLNGAAIGATLWAVTFIGLKVDRRLHWGQTLGGGIITLSALVGAAIAGLVALPVPQPAPATDSRAVSEPDEPEERSEEGAEADALFVGAGAGPGGIQG